MSSSWRSSSSSSTSATNSHGWNELNERLRSVLYHPLGLPLTQALNGKDPSELLFLSQEPRTIPNDERLDHILEKAVNECNSGDCITEPSLTKRIATKIEQTLGQTGNLRCADQVLVNYQSKWSRRDEQRCIDLLLSPRTLDDTTTSPPETTPLALIKVGYDNSQWWKSLDQNTKYVDAMLNQKQTDPRLQCDDALLCAVLTIAGDKDQPFQVKFGVFLCVPKRNGSFRMMLLGHVSAFNLKEASKAFGRFLRVTSWFADWRGAASDQGVHSSDDYEYLCSSCCRVGKTHVLRSYDSRFRRTDRSAEIYMSPSCKSIVGEVKVVMELPDEASTWVAANDEDTDPFWANSRERKLQIIAVPYKPGVHCAKRPADFIPIIRQLRQLHEAGFVHGDIRGFNLVFGEQGGLIDFDFGGRPGRPYPQGYRGPLADGWRIGCAEIGSIRKELAYWHDWYALGQLMFSIHWLEHDKETSRESNAVEIDKMERKWRAVISDPAPGDIEELISFLQDLDRLGWTVRPEMRFQQELDRA